MADFVLNTETIGSAVGRDFSTLAAYIAALPNPFVNEVRNGVVRADSDFDEKDIFVRPANRPADNNDLMVHGIPGETPTFKPASGSFTRILFLEQDMSLTGITVDGVNRTGGSGRGIEVNGFQNPVVGCVARNLVNGFRNIGAGPSFWLYCLAENCSGVGIGGDNALNNTQAMGCGAVLCGTGYQGRNATNRLITNACWSLSNTLAIGTDTKDHKFLYISDASFGAGDDVFINQIPGNLGFVNFAGGDYRLAAGSLLIAAGRPIWNRRHDLVPLALDYLQWAVQDAFGTQIEFAYGSRMNIGPFQPSRAVVPPVNTPPVLTVDALDKDGSLRYSMAGTSGKTWQVQVFDVTNGKELTAISGVGDLSDQIEALKATDTYKLVPMITSGGDRSNAAEPVWVGNKVGVND